MDKAELSSLNKKDINHVGIVVKIINEYRIIVKFDENKLQVGDKVAIYEPGFKVEDPDNGEELGFFSFTKAYLRVLEIQNNLAVCFSDEKEDFLGVAILTKRTPRKLNVNPDQNENLTLNERLISIGDFVKIVKE